MAEKKKGKKRKEDYTPLGDEIIDKPSKEEYSVAKWLRKNVPIKKTKFLHHNVEYFTGSKAVDGLLESPWAKGEDPLFKSREDVVELLCKMLDHKFFHRARKVPVSEEELKGRKKDKKTGDTTEKTKKAIEKEDKKEKTTDKEKVTDAESSVFEGKPEQTEVSKEKRKKKIRLDMHNDQQFVDSLDAYVWIYDPIPFHYWIIGTFLVLGAIGVCLFPLWPPSVRLGVYYLSVAAAGFLVFIILLAVLRLIIFCLVWITTLGNHHIWILPNLTEDVGFFASFWPLYTYEYKGGDKPAKPSKKKKKEKDSDAEEETEHPRKKSVDKSSSETKGVEEERSSENDKMEAANPGASESESESSQRSSTGKDFEMVEQDDLES